jgi:hypothetical protein
MFDNSDNGSEKDRGEWAECQSTSTHQVIEELSPRFALQMRRIHEGFLEDVIAIKKEAHQQGFSVNPKAILSIWQRFLKRVNTVFKRYTRLFDSAAKSEYEKGMAYELSKSAYDTVQKKFYFQIEAHTSNKIIPCVAKFSGKTSEALLLEFQVAVGGQVDELSPRVAPRKAETAKPSKSDSTMESVSFDLEHLAVPPKGILVRDVVRKLYPDLWKTIENAHIWVGQENRKNKTVLPKDIRERFPLLKQATDEELTEYVFGKATTPRTAAHHMMMSRSGLGLSSVRRYTRYVKDSKTIEKNSPAAAHRTRK